MTKVESSDDKQSSSFYTLECRISSFVLLPHIKFVLESRLSEQPALILPGNQKQRKGAKITKLLTEKHLAVTIWRLQLPFAEDITKIRCDAAWMSAEKVVSASWIPTERHREIGSKQLAADTISAGATVGISVAVIVIVALFVLQFFIWRKYKSATTEIRNLTKVEVDEFHLGNVTSGQEQDDVPPDSRPFVKNKIIKSQDLKTGYNIFAVKIASLLQRNCYLGYNLLIFTGFVEDTILAEGEFGIVYKGKLHGLEVAVKSSKLTTDIDYFKAFLKEIKVMAYIGEHENIVQFHGAVVDRIEENLCSAVIELSPFGNLNCYLRENSKEYSDETVCPSASNLMYANVSEIGLNHSVLTSFCQQIAAGMEFLTRKAVIHGDLATRNVLVFHSNVVKITDFGLSRKLFNCTNCTKTNQAPLPWRWMAIESLRYFHFSTKSDVWSFGVTMWEIFSLGRVPFAGVNWTTDFVDQLESGFRLMKPRLCTAGMFEWMMKCWSNEAEDRPTFTDCMGFLSNLDDHVLVGGNEHETSV